MGSTPQEVANDPRMAGTGLRGGKTTCVLAGSIQLRARDQSHSSQGTMNRLSPNEKTGRASTESFPCGMMQTGTGRAHGFILGCRTSVTAWVSMPHAARPEPTRPRSRVGHGIEDATSGFEQPRTSNQSARIGENRVACQRKPPSFPDASSRRNQTEKQPGLKLTKHHFVDTMLRWRLGMHLFKR
jgi:hypothetical protein